MDQLWSPWRSQYIQKSSEISVEKIHSCFLCVAAEHPKNDVETLVVARRKHCFVIMNRFPYNNGHIMVVPYRHLGKMEDFQAEELTDLMLTMTEANSVVRTIYKPDGINIGANIGSTAGAGVPDHLHFHIVPRWNGDTNFMPVLADIKVISTTLEDSAEALRAEFAKRVTA